MDELEFLILKVIFWRSILSNTFYKYMHIQIHAHTHKYMHILTNIFKIILETLQCLASYNFPYIEYFNETLS